MNQNTASCQMFTLHSCIGHMEDRWRTHQLLHQVEWISTLIRVWTEPQENLKNQPSKYLFYLILINLIMLQELFT